MFHVIIILFILVGNTINCLDDIFIGNVYDLVAIKLLTMVYVNCHLPIYHKKINVKLDTHN